METIQLKNSDLVFSRMALGTWAFSGVKLWGPSDDAAAIATVHAALDAGITVFDTADRYGDGKSEEVLGKALEGRRDRAVICSKVHTAFLGYHDVIAHCEDSLRRLGTDYLDIFQIHWPNPDIPAEETLAAFDQLKKDGKIRAAGACNFGPKCIREYGGHGLVTNQLPYSLLWRVIEKNGILEDSVAAGMTVWAYAPLAQGLLTGKYKTLEDVPMGRRGTRFYNGAWQQGRHDDGGFEPEVFACLDQLRGVCQETGYSMSTLALAFLKAQPAVSSILMGARTPEQLREDLEAFQTVVPPEVIRRVTELSEPLRQAEGENADLWENRNGGRMY